MDEIAVEEVSEKFKKVSLKVLTHEILSNKYLSI
jgi:hypothetical protein